MMTITDDEVLREFEEQQRAGPSPRKVDGHRIIYASRALETPDDPGQPMLCDFGDAHFGEKTYVGEVMPDLYRAPEILLGIPWDEKIDIWSVGLLVGGLFSSFQSPTKFTNRRSRRGTCLRANISSPRDFLVEKNLVPPMLREWWPYLGYRQKI